MDLWDAFTELYHAVIAWTETLKSQQAILITGILATTGWIVSASLTRKLSRKQHTMSALLADHELKIGAEIIRKYVQDDRRPSEHSEEYENWQGGIRKCLNYYEFLCSGILRRDFDEKLVRINERHNLLTLHQYAYSYIEELRQKKPHGEKTRDRSKLYQSIETVAKKWEKPWMRFP